jgi:hypothetical protein
MDDFLHNLRSGKLKQPERGRRDYTDFKGNQRRTGNERRRTDYYAKVTNENFALVKDSLDLLARNQKQIADVLAAGNQANLRIAEALEAIAAMMGRQWGYEALLVQTRRPLDAQTENETAEAVLPTEIAESGADLETANQPPSAEDRPGMIDTIASMRADGDSWEKIARHLEDQQISTLSGKGKWRGPAVKKFWDAHTEAAGS